VIRLIGAELLKLRKRQMSLVLLLILVGILVLIPFLLLAVSKAGLPGVGGGDMPNVQNLLGLPSAIPFALSITATFGVY
jgi:hypothetical protein